MNSSFRIIPVIDIMNGIAVHALKGKRNTYEPVKPIYLNSSNPLDLIHSYQNDFKFNETYIADLDSIIKEKPNLVLLEKITSESSIEIMLDAGIRNLYDIKQFIKTGIKKVILATETVDSLNVIDDAIKELGAEKLIVSIDMKNKKLIAESPEIKEYSMHSIVEKVYEKGIREIILLDLVRVGSKCGCFDNEYGTIRKNYKDLKILIGGGVRNLDDLKLLKEKKMNGALIATALHDGTIKKGDLI